ncbi:MULTISPECIES: hypothetical protein [unclassified Streptomyces]|uniref:hypothetical protein n=1 Tax=unclassified Streptomyces TaxID=2593676 RepID=UPI002E24C316|nr:hypothetical protein OG217_11470 [Streptomyces sp. NBC_01023]
MTRNKNATTSANWSVLAAMVGVAQPTTVFPATAPHGRQLRAYVEELVAEGRTQSGLLGDLTQVDRPDGTAGSWRRSLYPQRLWIEFTALRNAAPVFVTALSMMRDSAVREILKDSVVEHYGSPAVKSTLHKLNPNLPVKHWWIIEPVAQAVQTAAELSVHDTLAFASVQAKSPIAHLDSCQAIMSFVQHVNRHRYITGLPAIPEQRLSPHMFRRTMAMLTRDFPGSEIAVGMQLKHAATRALANTTTQGCTEPSPAWAGHLTTAISSAASSSSGSSSTPTDDARTSATAPALYAENAALREQTSNQSAIVVPLRDSAGRGQGVMVGGLAVRPSVGWSRLRG